MGKVGTNSSVYVGKVLGKFMEGGPSMFWPGEGGSSPELDRAFWGCGRRQGGDGLRVGGELGFGS